MNNLRITWQFEQTAAVLRFTGLGCIMLYVDVTVALLLINQSFIMI